MDIKSLIKTGFDLRDKGLELIGKTIKTAAEGVGLGLDESGLVRRLPDDIGNDESLKKEFLEIFKAKNPELKNVRIIINSKKWISEYQFNKLIEQNRTAVAIYPENGGHHAEYMVFTQSWTNNNWTNSQIKFTTSKSKIDPKIL